MNKKDKIKILIIIVLIMILAVVVKVAFFSKNAQKFAQTTESETVDVIETSTELQLADVKSEEYSNFDSEIDLTQLTSTGDGVEISDNTITITKAGTYYFSGKLEDGNIVVEASKDDKIVLVLDNAEITSSKTAVMNVIKAKNVTINLAKDSNNILTDSSEYTEFTDDDEPNSTIFSKSDLFITGEGTLKINANYEDAIASKDGLAIVDSTIEITANDDGIRGKDFVSIQDAKITIDSKGDGIKSTNDSDESLGYIIIDGAEINITSEQEGIQAETVLNITDSNITIKTTGEIETKKNDMGGFKKEESTTQDTTDKVSSKGLKAGKEITINSGKISVTSTDDAIHSNGYMIINNGEFTISSGDDGIHADNNILINNGTIDITECYEGIESNYIKINDGTISVVASDDGINVSGGNGMEMGGQENSGGTVGDSDRQLQINGGTIYVNAQGDGLDANGSIVINDGNVTVSGTTSGGNCALDYDKIFNMNGGSLIVYGATDMWQNPSTSSVQPTICFGISGNSGDKVVLKDASGKEIASFETEKSYGAIMISNGELKEGETYTIYVNGEEKDSQELTSIVTSNLESSSGMNRQNGRRGE